MKRLTVFMMHTADIQKKLPVGITVRVHHHARGLVFDGKIKEWVNRDTFVVRGEHNEVTVTFYDILNGTILVEF